MLLRVQTVLLLFVCSSPAVCGADEGPLKVFLLVGQSNMQGHAHVRTLEYVGMDDETKPMLDAIQDADGSAKVHENVYVSYLSAGGVKQGQLTTGFGASEEKIGPELSFGIYMQEMLGEPILIIKTAWGGKSIHTDFRPPSAGPYEFTQQQLDGFEKQKKDMSAVRTDKEKATGHYYRLMLEHIHKVLGDIKSVYPKYNETSGYELAGFVWFQGWNDMVDRGVYPIRDQPGGYDDYSKVLAHFIRDVRTDLQAPRLPFVIGVMGAGGPVEKYLAGQKRYAGIHQNFRDAMAAPARQSDFKGNVTAVLTEDFWDHELMLLRARDNELRQLVRKRVADGQLEKKQERATFEEERLKEFSNQELKILSTATSNAEYHYLGCAKILTQIGKAFAEANYGLLQTQE